MTALWQNRFHLIRRWARREHRAGFFFFRLPSNLMTTDEKGENNVAWLHIYANVEANKNIGGMYVFYFLEIVGK